MSQVHNVTHVQVHSVSPLIANVYLHYGAPGRNLVLLAGEIPAPARGAAASPGIESWVASTKPPSNGEPNCTVRCQRGGSARLRTGCEQWNCGCESEFLALFTV